jgi:hypothetical protein
MRPPERTSGGDARGQAAIFESAVRSYPALFNRCRVRRPRRASGAICVILRVKRSSSRGQSVCVSKIWQACQLRPVLRPIAFRSKQSATAAKPRPLSLGSSQSHPGLFCQYARAMDRGTQPSEIGLRFSTKRRLLARVAASSMNSEDDDENSGGQIAEILARRSDAPRPRPRRPPPIGVSR